MDYTYIPESAGNGWNSTRPVIISRRPVIVKRYATVLSFKIFAIMSTKIHILLPS